MKKKKITKKVKKKTSKKKTTKKVKKPKGRPTKYYPEICEEMIDFFSRDYRKNIKKEYIDKRSGEKKTVEIQQPIELPTFERFAFNNNLCSETLQDWKRKHKDFSASYEKCIKIQKDILIVNALLGGYKENFAKFVAMNFFPEMKERSEVDVTKKDASLENALTKLEDKFKANPKVKEALEKALRDDA